MTREEAKSLLPIITAFAEGKTILVKDKRLSDEEDSWNETDDCSFDIDKLEYRIKPESSCRPFKDAEECWQEMQKHQPFGWIQNIGNSNFKMSILSVDNEGVLIGDHDDGTIFIPYPFLFKHSIFVDGSLIGKND